MWCMLGIDNDPFNPCMFEGFHDVHGLWSPRSIMRGDIFLPVRERPLMTSDFRVGRGFQNDPKIGRFRVEKGR